MKEEHKWFSKYKLIAHAMGGINSKSYTNSLEAFQQNYQAGHRVFEVDFTLTKDRKLVARHDWRNYLNDWPQYKGLPLSLSEFKSLKICKMYTPIDISTIAHVMDKHRDIYLVTDTKDTNKKEVEEQFQLLVYEIKRVNPDILNRVVPQIYNEQMLEWIRRIYHFESVIYTLYQSTSSNDRIIDFTRKSGIEVVAMFDVRCSKDFVGKLASNGVYSYIHTINSLTRMKELNKLGVYGFYTDFVIPRDFNNQTEIEMLNKNE